jgi:tRNA(Met) C34 N-acetyltransferase TmcA
VEHKQTFRSQSVKTVLCIYSTRKKAREKFLEMIDFLGGEINLTSSMPMIIVLSKTQYRFIHMNSIEQLLGMEINKVIIDEIESLTEEQLLILKACYERTTDFEDML